jgi:NADPH:quinone reductase
VILVEPDGEPLTELSQLAGAGKLITRVALQLLLGRAAEAHTLLSAGGQRGKIILVP